MPITRGAIKKMRQDKKRAARNKKVRNKIKELIKKAATSPTEETLKAAISAIDRARKRGLYHHNKTARLKGKLDKLIKTKTKTKTKKKATPKLKRKAKPHKTP